MHLTAGQVTVLNLEFNWNCIIYTYLNVNK